MGNRFLRSSIGKKSVMALTGVVLFGFVVIHMLGNLQIFLGPEALNAYAKKLQDMTHLLWIARAILLGALVLHVVTAVRLSRENAAARPVKYATKRFVEASYASRTMMMSGIIVFAFTVYHLLHYTFGVTHPEYFHLEDAEGRHDVYSMVVHSFRDPVIALAYVAAMVPLALHLSHGVQSLFRSLGLNHPKYTPSIKAAGIATSLVIFAGNSAIPLAALFGLLKLPGGGG